MASFHKAKKDPEFSFARKEFSTEERRKHRRYGIHTYLNMTWGVLEQSSEVIEDFPNHDNQPSSRMVRWV